MKTSAVRHNSKEDFDIGQERIRQGLCPICGSEPAGQGVSSGLLPDVGGECLARFVKVRSEAASRNLSVPHTPTPPPRLYRYCG